MSRRSGRRWPPTSPSSRARLSLPTRLSQVGVPEEGIAALVEGAMGDGTAVLNPREMEEEDYAALYKAAL